jgi:hypothetical protein
LILRVLAIVFLPIGWSAALAQPLTFGPGNIGAPFSNAANRRGERPNSRNDLAW